MYRLASKRTEKKRIEETPHQAVQAQAYAVWTERRKARGIV